MTLVDGVYACVMGWYGMMSYRIVCVCMCTVCCFFVEFYKVCLPFVYVCLRVFYVFVRVCTFLYVFVRVCTF